MSRFPAKSTPPPTSCAQIQRNDAGSRPSAPFVELFYLRNSLAPRPKKSHYLPLAPYRDLLPTFVTGDVGVADASFAGQSFHFGAAEADASSRLYLMPPPTIRCFVTGDCGFSIFYREMARFAFDYHGATDAARHRPRIYRRRCARSAVHGRRSGPRIRPISHDDAFGRISSSPLGILDERARREARLAMTPGQQSSRL